MDRTTRFVLIAGVLGASVIASGAVGRASMQAELGTVERSASVSQAVPAHPHAVPYFPAQYVLDAPPGTSDPISTF